MLKRALILTALLTVLVLQAAPRTAVDPACRAECLNFYQTCPQLCGGSSSGCHGAYLNCLRGCSLYGQPWPSC
jgi:hypothetical protein